MLDFAGLDGDDLLQRIDGSTQQFLLKFLDGNRAIGEIYDNSWGLFLYHRLVDDTCGLCSIR